MDGRLAEWITAPGADDERVFLYLHGGSYLMGSPFTHRHLAAGISRAAGTRVLLLDYRLAPEYPFPAALEDARSPYRWLLDLGLRPDGLVVGGDSAGGGLSLSTLVAARNDGVPVPAGAVCISPWTDLAGTGESMVSKAADDPS